MLAEYRDHERECRAFNDGPLNSKRMKHHRLSMATFVMTADGHFILQYGEMRTSFRAWVQQRGCKAVHEYRRRAGQGDFLRLSSYSFGITGS
jgi:hypothetical protein